MMGFISDHRDASGVEPMVFAVYAALKPYADGPPQAVQG